MRDIAEHQQSPIRLVKPARRQRGIQAAQSQGPAIIKRQIVVPNNSLAAVVAPEGSGKIVVILQWTKERACTGFVCQQMRERLGVRSKPFLNQSGDEAIRHFPIHVVVSRRGPNCVALTPTAVAELRKPCLGGLVLPRICRVRDVAGNDQPCGRADPGAKSLDIGLKLISDVGIDVVAAAVNPPALEVNIRYVHENDWEGHRTEWVWILPARGRPRKGYVYRSPLAGFVRRRSTRRPFGRRREIIDSVARTASFVQYGTEFRCTIMQSNVMDEIKASIVILVAFCMPGFVASQVFRSVVAVQPPTDKSRLVSAITASAWLYAALSPCVYLLFAFEIPERHPAWFATAVLGALLIFPVVIGFALGRFVLSEAGRRLLNWLRVRHPSPRAWDHIFSRGERLFVIATLDDGTVIAGTWSGDSFAGDSDTNPDLYLDWQFTLDDNRNPVAPVSDSLGCYVQLGRVRCLEFRRIVPTVDDPPGAARRRRKRRQSGRA